VCWTDSLRPHAHRAVLLNELFGVYVVPVYLVEIQAWPVARPRLENIRLGDVKVQMVGELPARVADCGNLLAALHAVALAHRRVVDVCQPAPDDGAVGQRVMPDDDEVVPGAAGRGRERHNAIGGRVHRLVAVGVPARAVVIQIGPGVVRRPDSGVVRGVARRVEPGAGPYLLAHAL